MKRHIPMSFQHGSRLALFAFFVCSLCLTGADWPNFRGPYSSGASQETGLPLEWDASGKNVSWRVDLPGYGASSPIILGDRIYLTCYSGYGIDKEEPGDPKNLKRHVVCYSLTDGELQFDESQAVTAPVFDYKGFQALHGYASSTPTTDGKNLYLFSGATGAQSASLSGKIGWTRSVGDRTDSWGSATSPLLFEDLVIVNASVQSGALVGINKRTGKEVWRASDIKRSWSTPILAKTSLGETELVISSHSKVFGFDPKTGEKLWECKGVPDYVCPTAITHGDIVYIIGGRKNTSLAIKTGGRGDVTKTHRLWTARKGSNVSSPVYHDGHLYFFNESRGAAYCLDAKTGKTKFEERLKPRPGLIYSSPVVADGRIYMVSRNEGTLVLAADPEFKLLAHNEPLDESVFNGSPAIVDGKIILRSNKTLYCLESK